MNLAERISTLHNTKPDAKALNVFLKDMALYLSHACAIVPKRVNISRVCHFGAAHAYFLPNNPSWLQCWVVVSHATKRIKNEGFDDTDIIMNATYKSLVKAGMPDVGCRFIINEMGSVVELLAALNVNDIEKINPRNRFVEYGVDDYMDATEFYNCICDSYDGSKVKIEKLKRGYSVNYITPQVAISDDVQEAMNKEYDIDRYFQDKPWHWAN